MVSWAFGRCRQAWGQNKIGVVLTEYGRSTCIQGMVTVCCVAIILGRATSVETWG